MTLNVLRGRSLVASLTVFVLLLGAGVCTGAAKQLELNLDEAIRLALENDPAFLLAQTEVRSAQVMLEQAEAGNLLQPSPSLLFQAQVGLELAERSRDLAERSLILEVQQEYYTLLRIENIIGVLDEAIRLAERQLEVARKRFDSGAATALDVMKAESALATHKADKAQAEANLQLARRKFVQRLGLDVDIDLILDDTIVSENLPAITLEEALEEGMANRIELAQARAGVSIAEKELSLATNDYTPILTRRKAEIDLDIAKLRYEQAQQGIRLDIENSYHQMHDAYRRMELSEMQLAEAEESHRVVEALFAAGMATDVEILQAQTGLMQARSARVNAIFDFNMARTQMFHAIGWGPGNDLGNGEK